MTLYAVSPHMWGRHYDVLVPVQTSTCADCGAQLFKLSFLGMREFYKLTAEQVEISMLTDARWSKPMTWVGAEWARKNLTPMEAKMLYRGWDDKGDEQHYCHDCAKKTIEATCVRCHQKFTRTRDLVGGWACERCFGVHCTAMCNVKPGERVAGLVWNDKAANEHYAHEVKSAEEHLVAEGVIESLSGGAS